MKQFKYLIIFIAFLLIFSFKISKCFSESEISWVEEKSAHFIVYYENDIESSYVRELLYKAEKYYRDINDELGFRRFNYWTWDSRCKIYLYSSQRRYYNNTKQPSWSGGTVQIEDRIIQTFITQKDFNETILPHEMGHLIFREYVGYKKELPLWIDEGIACFVEESNRQSRLDFARRLFERDYLIPVDALTKIASNNLIVPNVFYSESASIVEFLLTTYGKGDFLEFCRKLKDGVNWEKALLRVYGFESLEEMNEKWVVFLTKERETDGRN